MEPKGFRRKLTAILSADVAGYSRLMQDDETATVTTLESYKQAFFDLIKQHRGRVVDSPGDNLLAEFASVVDAVQCAVAVQKEFHAHNAELPENRRMLFRIGVNLGDVIEEGDRIYGDGVNIAARLESLAEPGGICVSKTAFDQIETKLPMGYEYLGEQPVKNIAKPVGAYRVVLESRITEKKDTVEKQKRPGRKQLVYGLAGVLLLFVVSAAVWQFTLRSAPPTLPPVEKADPQKMAFPLPDKPSIAVLPFANMSDDKDFEYFSDGLTEEIINGRSKVDRVFVIARNSTFTYKGKPVKVQQVAEEMGVRYVLEGSVRKTGEKIRVTTQLVDALNGHHIFSERYDREFKDILTVQGEITINILAALQVQLTTGEFSQLVGKGTDNLEAYLKVLQSIQFKSNFNKESLALARRYAEEAIALDPEYFAGYNALAGVIVNEISIDANTIPRAEALQQALALSQKALSLNPSSSYTHSVLGIIYIFLQNIEQALWEAEQAVALSPNSALAYFTLGSVLFIIEKPHDAISMFQKSLRLSPIPVTSTVLIRLACAYLLAGQSEEAIGTFIRLLELWPDNLHGRALLAASYANCGRDSEARSEAGHVLRIDPNFNVKRYINSVTTRNQQLIEQWTTGLHKAGLK
jgi:adenylate cyclase